MNELIEHSFTNKDIERGYSVCQTCKDKIHTLQAGFECRRVACDLCGSSVVTTKEWNKGQKEVKLIIPRDREGYFDNFDSGNRIELDLQKGEILLNGAAIHHVLNVSFGQYNDHKKSKTVTVELLCSDVVTTAERPMDDKLACEVLSK